MNLGNRFMTMYMEVDGKLFKIRKLTTSREAANEFMLANPDTALIDIDADSNVKIIANIKEEAT